MSVKPKIRTRRVIANTGIFKIEEMNLDFSNGQSRRYQRIVGSTQGAVLAVPLLDDETTLLIREYAAGTDRYELAFPKGHIEPGEDPLEAANREIQEETGYAAMNLEKIADFTIAPGYLSHTTHVVLARNLYPRRLEGDEPEAIEVIPWRLDKLDDLLVRDEFTEARSIAAFFMVRERLNRGDILEP